MSLPLLSAGIKARVAQQFGKLTACDKLLATVLLANEW